MRLTSRERLRRCFFNEHLDRPGVYVRTGYPRDDGSYDSLRALLAARSDLKQRWNGRQFERPYAWTTTVEPHSDDYERCRTTLSTPKGELTSTRLVGLKGQPGYVNRHLLQGRRDADKYLSLPLPEVRGDTSSFFTADNRIGDRGIVDA